MLEELNKYTNKGSFKFGINEELRLVCNAPNDKSGVYLVYDDNKELIYIGRSGRVKKDGTLFIRKVGLGGIKDRLVNGLQFGKIPRRKSWLKQMQKEKIAALTVYWFITHTENYIDCPMLLEKKLLSQYFPRWNKTK